MSANQGRDLENPRREREMRAELIIDEMALAVRFLGGDGPAKEQNNRAARAARLPHTVIERLFGGRLSALGALLIYRAENDDD